MRKFGLIFIALALVAVAPSQGRDKWADESAEATRPVLFIDNEAAPGGNGSRHCPYKSLQVAIKNSKPGEVLYVVATGTPYKINSTLLLQDGQSLIGSDTELQEGEQPRPELLVETPEGIPAIAVTSDNRIVGFVITGSNPFASVAISTTPLTSAVKGLCLIAKNDFRNLAKSIDLSVEASSAIDIDGNSFSDGGHAILLGFGEEAKGDIHGNSFENIDVGIESISTCLKTKSTYSKNFLKRVKELHRRASEGTFTLSVRDNSFQGTLGSSSGGIIVFGAETLTLRDNLVSDFAIGLFAQAKRAHLVKSSFIGGSEPNVLDSQMATLEHNAFDIARRAITNLEIRIRDGGTLCAGGNTFRNGISYGLVIANEVDAESICIRLEENHGGHNGINNPNGADFLLRNPTKSPELSLFQVAVPNPAKGKQSLTRANFGSSVRILPNDAAVSYVESCPECRLPQ